MAKRKSNKQVKAMIEQTQNVLFLYPQKPVVNLIGKQKSIRPKCVKNDNIALYVAFELGYTF